ncbi:GNAT family N-acetyltransferase [Pseudomonas sp. HMWF032]|uniref:GNAT family N-acetyltransferase n=1 Tax=unclassified Pseudomonas TaxID=196821 RepID=UPI000D344FD2|nr:MULTISPECIES: GNAT family N-acetyltransferase [unclassified Pseudomonas]PTS86764.1 GNAT family N-acetyltransferase [Pseudomonas sp. HMWF032]PTT79425.1 GNAT family N-acetyltransferase [Pseudomonas sp. HMWF010]WAC43477.1 GNAT family N-acetyltransferase [Pseudomonas sp. SL4(2022)]
MFTLVHLDSPPPESLNSQVLQMVVDYLSDISPVSLTPSNPLYQLYQYVMGYEMHLYLRAMHSEQPSSARLILALSDQDPSQVLGFALYLPAQDAPEACTLAYMAVQASQRRHGIARALLQQMISRHPHAELACVAGKVATFEAMGFQVLAARGPQVLMSTRNYSANGMLAVQDLAPIFQSTEVRQIHTYLLKQHGKRAMSDAEKQRDRLLDQMAQHAQALVRERLTVH